MLDRITISTATGLFLLALAVYLATLAPTFVFTDTAELALVVRTGGVPHPPGFPLYLVLAGLWSHLPLGADVAWRLNVLSAVLGAACAPVIYFVVRVTLSPASRGPADAEAATEPPWLREAPGATAALLFVFSHTFWRQATITEVYTLNMLMASLVLLAGGICVQRARDRRPLGWALAIFGLVGGLGLANHITLALMYFGVGGMVLLAPAHRCEEVFRRFWVPIACGSLGLLLYAVLPLRASAEPLVNWGNPHDWPHFLRHVTGWQFHEFVRPTGKVIGKNLSLFLWTALTDFTILPLVLVPFGCLRLAARNPVVLLGWVAGMLPPFLWSLGYDIAGEQQTYFLIPFLILALLMGAGAAEMARAARRNLRGGARRAGPPLALAAVSLLPLAANLARDDRSDETEARRYALDVLEPLERDALVFTRYWHLYAPTMYLQHLEGVRPDVDIVDMNLVKFSWYIPYLERAHPRSLSGLDEEVAAFRVLLARWEDDGEGLPQAEQDRFAALYGEVIDGMIERAWRDGRPVYATRDAAIPIERRFGERGVTLGASPDGLAFRLLPDRGMRALPPVQFRNTWERESRDPVAVRVRRRYANFWAERGRYFEASGESNLAVDAYLRADALSPGSEAVGEALKRLGGR